MSEGSDNCRFLDKSQGVLSLILKDSESGADIEETKKVTEYHFNICIYFRIGFYW